MRHFIAACALITAAAPALATENKVVQCRTYNARMAGPSGGPALVANVPSSMMPIDLNAVLFNNRKLDRQVIVEVLFAQRTPVGGLRVMARLVNCTDKTLTVQARSNFMDVNQLPTEAASMWRTLYLSPRATTVYEENSIGQASVGTYLIELRPES